MDAMNSATSAAQQTDQGHRKAGVDRRVEHLRAEISVLTRERRSVAREIDALRAEHAELENSKELKDANQQLETENSNLRALLAKVDPEEYERLKKADEERVKAEARVIEGFVEKCQAARTRYPDFDDCVKAIGTIPTTWTRVIASLPNCAEFILFLGRSQEFRMYLRQLKDAAAIHRIQQAAFELRQSTRNTTGA